MATIEVENDKSNYIDLSKGKLMKEKRVFPTPVLLSITTGVLMCESFGLMHEAAEFIMGHPIWTHHFANEDLNQKLRDAVLKQHPDLTSDLADDVNSENVWEKVGALVEKLGATRDVIGGNFESELGMLDGIPKDKEVVVVEVENSVEPNPDLMWVQAAAHGDAHFGYDRENLNDAGAVKEILRIRNLDFNMFEIEHWKKDAESEFSQVFYSIGTARKYINNMVRVKNDKEEISDNHRS